MSKDILNVYKKRQMKGLIVMEMTKIPEFIMKNVREMLEIDENDNSQDDKILQNYSKTEIFDMYMRYEGIIGYTDSIISAIEAIFDINIVE